MSMWTFVLNVVLVWLLGMGLLSAEENGLVTYYTFDEGSGNVLKDKSSSGNTGTIHGAVFVKRDDGFALKFDGVDDYVDCSNPPSLNIRDVISIEAWVYPEKVTSGESGILGKTGSVYMLTYYQGRCYWYISGGPNNVSAPLATRAWHHIVSTFNGETLRLYVDGKINEATSNTDSINSGEKFFMGLNPGPKSYFAGMLDEVRIYRRILTEKEILQRFQEGSRQGDTPGKGSEAKPDTAVGSKETKKDVRPVEKDGVIARWDFDEGSGTVVKDVSGNGNNGTIYGAEYVRRGKGYVLKFNGQDAYVDCETINGMANAEEISIEAWIFLDGKFKGEPGVINVTGAGRYDLQISCWYGGMCAFYINMMGSGNYARSEALQSDTWHHVVGTYDGKVLRFYQDGRLENAYVPASKLEILRAGTWYIGTQTPQAGHFLGMIDDVAIYRRALTSEEIREHYKTSGLTGEVSLKAYVFYFRNKVVVTANLYGLGWVSEGAVMRVSMFGEEMGAPLCENILTLSGREREVMELPAKNLRPGKYRVRAVVTDKAGMPIGREVYTELVWPELPRPAEGKVLNNLVTQLLDVSTPKLGQQTRFEFANPKEGPVYIRTTAAVPEGGRVTVSLGDASAADPVIVHEEATDSSQEAMRFLPPGKHTITVRAEGKANLNSLVVRAVPLLMYECWRVHSSISEYPKYDDLDFLYKDVVRNVNAIRGGNPLHPSSEKIWNHCKQEGKRWFNTTAIIHNRGEHAKEFSADYVAKQWISTGRLDQPEIAGVFIDENNGGSAEEWAAWTEAIRKIRAETGKIVLTYCGPIYSEGEAVKNFFRAEEECGGYFAYERYLGERPGMAEQLDYLHASLAGEMEQWTKALPGSEKHMIIVPGYFSGPPESLDTNPAIDFKTVLDMEMNILANDPACRGVAGVKFYMSAYADEEMVRWAGRLLRHYGIEGKSNMLSDEYGFRHTLTHIQNPGFEHGTQGWNLSPAEQESMEVRNLFGFGYLWGCWPGPAEGEDNILWMKRSGMKPNVFSQEIRNLEPGRLYNLRFIVADYGNLTMGTSQQKKVPISIKIDGAEMLPSKCFQSVFLPIHRFVSLTGENMPWLNFVWQVFRAKNATARLTISDWTSGEEPGGPIEQELIFGFMQLQPYFED